MKTGSYFQRLICLVLVGCLLLSGCAANPFRKQSVSEQFDSFIDELFREEVVSDTITLHYTLAHPDSYGITDYDITLGELTPEAFEASSAESAELRDELLAFDVSQLAREQKLTYDILLDCLDTELSVEDLYLYTEILGPTTGYQAQLPVILAEYTFRTRQDIEDYLALLAIIDDLFGQIVAFEEEKSRAGLFMSDSVADSIISQCSAFIEEPENNYMIDVFNDKIASFEGLTDEEREDYIQRNRNLITTEVVAAYQTLIDGLTALKGTGTNDLGLCYYEDGTRYYEYLVRTKTGSDDSVEELQERTQALLQTCVNNMVEVAMADPDIWVKAYEAAFPVSDPEAIVEDLIGKIYEDFPEIPDVDYTIKYVHSSMEEDSSPAFYLTPPLDDSQNNIIYINRLYMGDEINNPLYPTLAHEGYPGHLYQNVYFNSTDLPLIRSLLSYSGYTEGWATYVEFYSYGISGMEPSLANARLQDSIFALGIYSYVDMGIHYNGWTVSDVSDYLASWGISGELAQILFDTMLEEPAVYLSYFIGYMEFMELREQAEAALGEDFILKDFHKFLLDIGPAPFYIIEQAMADWIEAR